MARDLNSKCKKCRRAGEKLFLKGDRCASPKCAMVRRPYAPGAHGKSMSRSQSEYGKQLAMKQRIKRIYGVLERQFRKHFEDVRNKPGVIGDLLIARLEMRLDNVVRRMGYASSPSLARQMVSHGMFTVNGKRMTIPSCEVKVGDVIAPNPLKKDGPLFTNQAQILKNKKDFPSWIQFDAEALSGKVVAKPSRADVGVKVDPQMVVEFYSR
ncbi:MAG TPA: 30S ribosomal protein S4 [Candidatus Moranbacteria bacterium]|nr:30S ribosomal protein S4 [Candidatus Moranbacteria bacterium]